MDSSKYQKNVDANVIISESEAEKSLVSTPGQWQTSPFNSSEGKLLILQHTGTVQLC